jgi:hypothetical protein
MGGWMDEYCEQILPFFEVTEKKIFLELLEKV